MCGIPQKCAWVTLAIDETTAKQAIILAKSLARVSTKVEAIILISDELNHTLPKFLAQYFVTVIPVNIKKQQMAIKFNEIEILKLFACTLELYSKLVVLNPNNLILKNCDELFNLEMDFYILRRANHCPIKIPIFIVKPSLAIYTEFLRLGSSYDTVPDIFYAYADSKIKKDGKNEIPSGYYSVQKYNAKYPQTSNGDSPKIVSFEILNRNSTTDLNIANDIKDDWDRIWKELSETMKNFQETNNNIEKNIKSYNGAIAIVGLSCRFPEANNSEEFWELLRTGRHGNTVVPIERMEYSRQLRNDMELEELQRSILKCPIDEFDANFFEISSSEAELMDPQQRLLLEVAWEALEDAAIIPGTLTGGGTGVFSGFWQSDYSKLVKESIQTSDAHKHLLGTLYSASSARISHFLGLNGPNIVTESGCSSSMVALHLACDSLRKKETDLCLVMGANLTIDLLTMQGSPLLSKDGFCKTFDTKADGFARAEGIVVLVAKRLSDAIICKDRILGIVRGSALSSEGTSTFGTPSQICQEFAIRDALKSSSVSPDDVDFVEAHGTGTAVGDPVEFAALCAGYAGDSKRPNPLVIGSVKSNIGHTEAASGLAGIVKVILAMEHEFIPRHINFETLNPKISLKKLPAIIPVEGLLWKRSSNRVRMAGVSSFGISGTNVHAILEEPPLETIIDPAIIKPIIEKRSHHILTLSAKTEEALGEVVNIYTKYLHKRNDISIRDFTYTSNVGRTHFKNRLCIVGTDILNIRKSLEDNNFIRPSLNSKPKIAFIFTGQGSQNFSIITNNLYKTNLIFKNAFDECSLIIMPKIGKDLRDIFCNDTYVVEEKLCRLLMNFSIEYSLVTLLISSGANADYILGYSFGEYVAAVVSGILTLQDALSLLIAVGQLTDTLPIGKLLTISVSKSRGEELILQFVENNKDCFLDISMVNSSDEITVSGRENSIVKFQKFCIVNGITVRQWTENCAYHSRDMDTILNLLEKASIKINHKLPNCGYVSGTTGLLLSMDGMSVGSYWQKHIRETVNFDKGVNTLLERECNIFIEIGAHPVLTPLERTHNISLTKNIIWLACLKENRNSWETILETIGTLYTNGVDIDWLAIHAQECSKKIDLPTYPFQRQKFWINTPGIGNWRVHPLLGKRLPLAACKDIIYDNKFFLNDFPFLKGHVVANHVIMPGAGFLEIILAAGKDLLIASYHGSKSVLYVKDFVIEEAMEMVEGVQYEIQIVATCAEAEGNQSRLISVYSLNNSQDDNKISWTRHGHGLVTLVDEKYNECKYVKENLCTIKSRCEKEILSGDFYSRIEKQGISFGKPFQSISTIFFGEYEAVITIPVTFLRKYSNNYIFHPIILDAMIQAFGFIKDTNNCALYLPIGIGKLYSFNVEFSDVVFAHVQWNRDESNGTVSLYNGENQLLLVMEDIFLLQTSTESFLNAIRKQKKPLPGLYENVWRPSLGPLENRIDVSKLPNLNAIIKPLNQAIELQLKSFNSYKNSLKDDYVCLRLIKLFREKNLNFEIGKEYNTSAVMYDNSIALTHIQFFNRCIDILAEDGFITRLDFDVWKINKKFPSLEEIDSSLLNTEATLMKYDPAGTDILVKCFGNLWNVLIGKVNPVAALFARDDMNILDMYTKGVDIKLANIRMAHSLHLIFNSVQSLTPQNGNKIVRIIEIGGGSASSSIEVLKLLNSTGISCQYTFTDVSSQFFEGAMKTLSSFDGVEYKVLDIEKDPAVQGFCPNYYDVVIASNVIHATENLTTSLYNTRKLIVNNGLLILQEQLRHLRTVDIIYGILDSYWKFTDKELRGDCCMVAKRIWDSVLLETGFLKSHILSNSEEDMSVLIAKAKPDLTSNVISRPSNRDNTWLIFGEGDTIHNQMGLQFSNYSIVLIRHEDNENNTHSGFVSINMFNSGQLKNNLDKLWMESGNILGIIYMMSICYMASDPGSWYLKALNFCKYVAENVQSRIKLLVVTRGAVCLENGHETVRPAGAVIWGMMKSLMNEVPHLSIKIIDLDLHVVNFVTESKEIFFESFSSDEYFVCYRNSKRFVPRFVKHKKEHARLSVPHRCKLDIPKSKRIGDVCYTSVKKVALDALEIEVAIRACALNFRDIFCIIKPELFTVQDTYVGVDFSGVVSSVGVAITKFKVGDEVFGFGKGTASSHVVIKPGDGIFHKASSLSFFEATTIPAACLTAHYSLIKIAHLKSSDTILIHTASGGVGLFAIQIAKAVGANIVATAGSRRKRSYLRSIGIVNVFHSRDLTFEQEIKKITNGSGVDVVLNTLTGPGFKEATLNSCGQNSRFVEISKLNIWQPCQAHKLRADVAYTVFDIAKLTKKDLEESCQYISEKGAVTPLPYSRFDVADTRQAFQFFLKAEHIGKIILSFPHAPNSRSHTMRNDILFSNEKTYLITGGLQGIGLKVAQWMISCGAECIVLVGRKSPNHGAVKILNKLRNEGCRLHTFEADVGDWSQCLNLFQSISSLGLNLPPLKGVIHSAGVLSDAIFSNQTWEKYETVFNAKVRGCWNLHNITKNMNLEYFVLFSSIAAIVAPIGQSNHTAANCFLDSFAHYRHSIGLPAQTINWGAWSGVGSALNSQYVKREDAPWQAFNCGQGISTLKYVLSRPDIVQVAAAELNMGVLSQTTFVGGKYFEELLTEMENNNESQSLTLQPNLFWQEIESKSLPDRLIYIQLQLSNIIKTILKPSDKEVINEGQPFHQLGIDSLGMIELRNKIQMMLGENNFVDSSFLVSHQTIKQLSYLLGQHSMKGKPDNVVCDSTIQSNTKIKELLKQDSVLPNEIKGLGNFVKSGEVRKIFLTGATGQMSIYLLAEMFKYKPNTDVYCLVRAKSLDKARDRFVKNLEDFQLLDCINLDRIFVVVGDIVEDQLGIANDEYEILSASIDAVYHMAANINLTEAYSNTSTDKSDIRAVNVEGLVNILKFASNIRTKRVFYASSIVAINKLTSDGLASEDFPGEDNNGEGITMGYAMTKFVSEKLLKQALDRGIPCTIIRYPSIMGNSKTGQFSVNHDLMSNLLLVCTKLGQIFKNFKGGLPIMSADNAAKITVQLLLDDAAPFGVYNLWQPNPVTSDEFVKVLKQLGYTIKTVSEKEFFENFENVNPTSFLKVFQRTYGSNFLSLLYDTTFILKRIINTKNEISRFSRKLTKIIPNASELILNGTTLIKRFMIYAETSGIFKDLEIYPKD